MVREQNPMGLGVKTQKIEGPYTKKVDANTVLADSLMPLV